MPFHLSRIQNLAANISRGDILPTVYGDALKKYGYASSFFYPDHFLYLPAALTAAGIKLIRAYQIFLLLITLVTAITMYLTTLRLLEIFNINQQISFSDNSLLNTEQIIALLATLVYLAFPYRLLNLYFRGAIGEVLAFIFIPVTIVGTLEIFYSNKSNWKLPVIGIVGLLYSHLISLFMTSGIVICIILLNYKKSMGMKNTLLKIILFIAGIGAAFLIPLAEHSASNVFYFNKYNPFGTLSDQTIQTGLSLPVIVLIAIHMAGIRCLVVSIRKHRSILRKYMVLLLFLTACFTIMATDLFPWSLFEKLPLVDFIRFPWRYLMFTGYTSALLFSTFITKRYLRSERAAHFFTTYLLILLSSLGFIAVITIKVENITKPIDYTPPEISVAHGEYLPTSFRLEQIKQKFEPRLTTGVAHIKDFNKTGNISSMNIITKTSPVILELPIVYYKGYIARLNERRLNLNQSKNGLIEISIHELCNGKLEIHYQHTPIQLLSYVISALAGILFIIADKDKTTAFS